MNKLVNIFWIKRRHKKLDKVLYRLKDAEKMTSKWRVSNNSIKFSFFKVISYKKTVRLRATTRDCNWLSLRKKSPYSGLLWSAFFRHFPVFGLNTKRYSVFLHSVCLRIQSECGEMRTRITPNTETFYAVYEWLQLTVKDYELE